VKRALVLIQDNPLRETVLDVLHDAQILANGVSGERTACTILRRIREPLVVVVDERYASLLDGCEEIAPHERIVLDSSGMLRGRQVRYDHSGNAVLPLPFEIDVLVRQVELACASVEAAHPLTLSVSAS